MRQEQHGIQRCADTVHNSQSCDSSMNHNVPRSSGMVSGQQELPSSLRNPPLRSACHMSLQASFPDRVSALHFRDSSMQMQPRRRRMLYTLFLQIFLPYCCAVHDIFCLPPRRFSQKISSPSPLDKGKKYDYNQLVKKVPLDFFAKLLPELQNRILQHYFAILPLRRVMERERTP